MAMYYNPPPNAGAAIQHEPAWSRTHHSVLSGSGANGAGAPMPPPSPAYAIPYTNGTSGLHHHHSQVPQHQTLHQHQNSLSHSMGGYPSPTMGPPGIRQASPPDASTTQMIANPHWTQQMMKAELCRQASSPHHRARASALATRNSAKSAIPITDPNRPAKPIQPIENGASHDGTASEGTESENGARPMSTDAQLSLNPHTPAPIHGLRPAVVRKPEASWTALDMGGMRLKNVSTSLFNFGHLTTLYLNHNMLSSIPPAIARLRNLTVLDISGNQLMSVPPELGMLTSLKELYLFDNHIANLPPELGTLFQLELLGIEGNPIDSALKTMVQKEGTAMLIAYLRDSCPVTPSPPQRTWKRLQSDGERKQQDADPSIETFTMLCYNILCEKAATPQMYAYTPSWALAWDFRKELILTEIMNYDADFLCLQEVDVAQYEEYFFPRLAGQDYDGVYWPRSRAKTMAESERRKVDGLAMFFKKNKYRLVDKRLIEFNHIALQREDFLKNDDMFARLLTKDHIAVAMLVENIATGARLVVCNVHIHWDPEYRDVKLVQVALMMDELERMSQHFAKIPPRPTPEFDDASGMPVPRPPTYSEGTKIPTIVCGDFNSTPGSGVHDFLANGSVPSDHEDFMNFGYGNFTLTGLKHRFGLKNAYASLEELTLTNLVPGFQGVIDYIWYSAGSLSVSSLLSEIDPGYLSKVVGFPNAHFPSDHICLMAEFRVKPQKETAGRPPLGFPVANGVSRIS